MIKSKKKDFKLFPQIFVALFFVFASTQIFLANSLSVQGREISRLSSLKSDLEKEVEGLQQFSLSLSSLGSLRRLASEKLQMVDSLENFDYLEKSVALR